jgi:lysozyme
MELKTRSRQRRLLLPRIALAATAALLGAMLINPTLRYRVTTLFTYPLHYKEYKHFGIRIPGNYQIHGIDVSRWQQRVDWARVKKMKVNDIHIHFVFIKATEGSWADDPKFNYNWDYAKRNNITRGAYHFFLPDISPRAQAVNFIQSVRLRSGDLPPVVDVEEVRGMTREQIQRYTKEFMNLLEKHYKIKPILYTNRDFYKQYFANEPDFKPYILWIAHYHVSELTMPDDAKWHFWQHSDKGTVNGINEKVDFNVFNGDSAAFRRLCLP